LPHWPRAYFHGRRWGFVVFSLVNHDFEQPVDARRQIFAENSFIERDPTEGVRIPLPRTDGFHSWTEDEIAQFEARWPIGTRERLTLTILRYTGLRRGDAVRLGRQHIKNGIIALRAGKMGAQIIIPVLPELAAIINASRTGDLALIAGKLGQPMTKESFGNWFHGACQEAGVPGSAHGLRKVGATRAASPRLLAANHNDRAARQFSPRLA
jgi:integrase